MTKNAVKLFLVVVSLAVLVGYVVEEAIFNGTLSESSKKVIEEEDVANVLQLIQYIDQLKSNSNPQLAIENIVGFGGIFSAENRKLPETEKLIDRIAKHIDSLRNQNASHLLARVVSEGTVALLPKDLKTEFDSAKQEILTAENKVTLTSKAYNYLYVFNELLPKLKVLLEDKETITPEKFLSTFYEAKISKIKTSIAKNMLEEIPVSLLEEMLSKEEVKKLQVEIDHYEKVVHMNMDTLKKYRNKELYRDKLKQFLKEQASQKASYYIDEYRSLEQKVDRFVEDALNFEEAILKEYESLQKLLNRKANAAVIKARKELENVHGIKNYIDIIPRGTSEKPDFWLRLRLPPNSIQYLREHQKIDGVTGSISLVYKIEIFDDNTNLKGSTFLPKVQLNTQQVDSLKAALKKVVSEVPLGIEISNLSIATASSQNSLLQLTGCDGTGDDLKNLQILIPKNSPWTNFKSKIEDQKEIFNRLQVSRELGLEIDHITINTDDFDAEFSFHVKSTSLLRDLLNSKKDANTFQFKLSELRQEAGFISDKLRELAGKKVAERLQAVLDDQDNQENIKRIFLADEITSAKVVYSQDHIEGSLKFVPIGFAALNKKFEQKASVNLLFKTSLENGRSTIEVSNTFLPYETLLRDYVKTYLESTKESLVASLNRTLSESEYGNLLLNLSQNVQFSKFQLDIERREIAGQMWIKEHASKKMKVSVTRRGLRIENFETTIKEIIRSKFENYVASQFEEPIRKQCNQLAADKMISLYTFDFRIEDVDCNLQNANATFKAVYTKDPKNFARLKFEASGNAKILELSVPAIEQEMLTKMETDLAEYSDFKYFKVKNPRFEKGILLIDAYLHIEVLGLYEKVGSFEIAPNDKTLLEAKFNGFDIRTAFENKINSLVQEEIAKLIERDKLSVEFAKGASGLSIKSIEKVALFGNQKELVFKADAKLKGFVVPDFKVTLNLSADSLLDAIKVDVPPSTIINTLLANASFMKKLGGEIVPGLNVSIEELSILIDPIRIEGLLKIEINNLTLPSMKFEVTQKDVRFHPTLQFPFPGAYLISASPPLTLYGSDVTIDLDEKKISFNTNVTVGTPINAEASSRLINLKGSLSAYYAGGQFGNLDLEANLYLITVLNVMEGKGQLQTSKGCFEMSSKTKGPLRNILKFDNRVVVNCDNILFSSQMAMDVLGIKMNSNMSARKTASQSAIDLAGEVEYDFLGIAHLRGSVSSKLEVNNITSFAKNTSVALGGDFEIGGFELSSVDLGANYNNAYLDFSVLGANLGIEVPGIRDFTEGMILDKILSLLDFDPEVLLEILKDPTKISFKIAPMGVGKGSHGDASDGNDGGGNGGSGGNGGAGSGNGTENTKPSGEGQTSTKLVDNGTKVALKTGVFSNSLTVKLMPISQVRWVNSTQAAKFPPNIKRALVVVNRQNNVQLSADYLSEAIANRIQSNFNYWITRRTLQPIKRNGNESVYQINKEAFTTAYNPRIEWNVCFDTNDKVYIYLSQPYINMYQFETFFSPTLDKDWVDNHQYNLMINIKNRTRLSIDGNQFRVLNVPINRNTTLRSFRFHPANSRVYTSSKGVFFKNGNRFVNNEGTNIISTNLINRSAMRKLRRQYESFDNIKAIVIAHDSQLLLLEEDDIASVRANRLKNDDEIRPELERVATTLGKVWIEIPKSSLNTIFGQEPWFNASLKFHENIRTLQTGSHQGKIETKAYNRFLALVQSLIENPDVIPNSRLISVENRELLLTTNAENQDKSLMDLTPRNTRRFNNYNPWILRINNNDLTEDLGLVNKNPVDFENTVKSDKLVFNALISIMDRRVFGNDFYLGKNQDKLFFKSGNRLKIQSKDSLWTIKTVLDLNAIDENINGQKLGDLFTKPVVVKKHSAFFNELFPVISSEKDIQLVIEENEDRLIAYVLDNSHMHILWETASNVAQIRSKKIDRVEVTKAIARGQRKKAELILINSLNEKSYTLEELLRFIKKGYQSTKNWFSQDEDLVHSFTILKY